MIIKDFAYKLREDMKRLFFYPDADLSRDYIIDYAKYWEKRGRKRVAQLSYWQRQRADILIEMIEPGSTVIDIGCGDGALLAYVKSKIGIKAIGVDLSESILENAKNVGIETLLMDVNDMKSVRTLPPADYVIGFEIIEHMPNPEEFIANIKEKAAKGLIFSFPNTGYYLHRLRLLFGSFPMQWITHPGEHVRYWTVRDVKKWGRMLRLPIVRLKPYEGLPILNRVFPSLFCQGIVVELGTKFE